MHRTLENWQLKLRDRLCDLETDWATEKGWIPAQVPGTVQEALLAAGYIRDPFIGLNEREIQWIGEHDWMYRCQFDLSEDELAAGVRLCCAGLDTIATVWLNGERIIQSNNMFVPQQVAIKDTARVGSNRLEILFESALYYGREQEERYGQRPVWNGDTSRVHVRKAQYHYGWDWGPCLMTAGPWLPVTLEFGTERIEDLYAPVSLTDDHQRAMLELYITLEAVSFQDLTVAIQLYNPQGQLAYETTLTARPTLKHSIMIDDVQLWWPYGYGEQALYDVVVVLNNAATTCDKRRLRVGMRSVRLIQEPLDNESGSTFLFEINRVPIFCGGANWIPADSFLPRITESIYRDRLEQTRSMHMVMVRVWGGGVYEPDCFYDLCDELGLLVWQDFMFACGIYPAHPEFVATVTEEAQGQIRRLRNHASLVLWCGNNEDYQIAQSFDLYDAEYEGDFASIDFEARELYERVLPEQCADLDPSRPYWPGSSYGGQDVLDPTVGDRHTWEIWHGPMAPYQQYSRYEGRFVSEFGMQAAPVLATIERYVKPEERFDQSRTMDHHNKAEGGPGRLAAYLTNNIRVDHHFESYVYATQFIQAEALTEAYRSWRRRWSGLGRYSVAGALVWQLNDCWPATTWSVLDYYGLPKPAFYAIRRELAPYSIGLERSPQSLDVWATNSTMQTLDVELYVFIYNLSGKLLATEVRTGQLLPNQATEFGNLDQPCAPEYVYAAQLACGDQVIARTSSWPQPLKYYDLPEPALTMTKLDDQHLEIATQHLVKGLWLTSATATSWSDNMIDVFPHESQVLVAPGLGDQVRVQCVKYQTEHAVSFE